MSDLAVFMDMGGYGAFVWPAFAVTAVVMTAMAVISRRALRAAERRLAELERQQPTGSGT